MAPEVLAAGLPAGTTGPPRKSLSMGALKQGIAPTGPAPVHKKRPGDVDHKRDGKWNISTNFFSSDPTCVCFPRGLEPFQVAKSIDLFSYEDVSPSGIFLTFACFSFPFFLFFFFFLSMYHRDASVGVGAAGWRNGGRHHRRSGARGRRARGGYAGLENSFQVRIQDDVY